MRRQWVKILVLVLALLSQMAATCSTGGNSSNLEGTPPARSGY
jgi:hypothetical protein